MLSWSLEINKTVIVASRWFLFYLTYVDHARSNTNQGILGLLDLKYYTLKKTKEINKGSGRQIYTTYPVWEDNKRLVKDVFQGLHEDIYKKSL